MISMPVNDQSQIAEARRQTTALAKRQGFDDGDAGRVALVTTELATNLIKHARGGEILAGPYEDEDATAGIQLIALDQGPGMVNVAACVTDGTSSAGTAGHGLGAVIRQSDFVDIASWSGLGTAILAKIHPRNGRRAPAPLSGSVFGVVSVAKSGEDVCGDAWAIDRSGPTTTLLVADGLGHGPDAAEAAVEAVRLFRRFHAHQVPTLLDYVHGGLRSTRGAAVSVARHDPDARRVIFAGIGNVAGMLAAGSDVRRMVSMPGTAGYSVRRIQSFEYPFEAGLMILSSDGVSTNWTPARYPNLHTVHPVLVAAVLYRDFGRRRDDATVLVGKWTPVG